MEFGDSFIPQTNESRQKYKQRRKSKKQISVTPLMQLGSWMFDHGHDITDAPRDLLKKTLNHVESRLKILSDTKQNSRVRAQMKWLTRWSLMIKKEMKISR